jgi:hypothetical protein
MRTCSMPMITKIRRIGCAQRACLRSSHMTGHDTKPGALDASTGPVSVGGRCSPSARGHVPLLHRKILLRTNERARERSAHLASRSHFELTLLHAPDANPSGLAIPHPLGFRTCDSKLPDENSVLKWSPSSPANRASMPFSRGPSSKE